MTRPLTRKEWAELVHAKVATLEHRGYLLMPAQMARIAATIEAGGFAPEPPAFTEADLLEWLYRKAEPPEFQDRDYVHAFRKALFSVADLQVVTDGNLFTIRHGHSQSKWGGEGLAEAARILAALAHHYSTHTSDALHFLGGRR